MQSKCAIDVQSTRIFSCGSRNQRVTVRNQVRKLGMSSIMDSNTHAMAKSTMQTFQNLISLRVQLLSIPNPFIPFWSLSHFVTRPGPQQRCEPSSSQNLQRRIRLQKISLVWYLSSCEKFTFHYANWTIYVIFVSFILRDENLKTCPHVYEFPILIQ